MSEAVIDGEALRDLARGHLDQHDLDGAWFELGGSSLGAARLVGELAERFDLKVTLVELLLAPSVDDLFTDLVR